MSPRLVGACWWGRAPTYERTSPIKALGEGLASRQGTLKRLFPIRLLQAS
jgi:hypothetical protein